MNTTQEPSRARQIELILQQVETLPTLSPIATRLLEVSSADDADLREIARIIESDPALTVRILGMCRKASVGLGRITSVQRAVVMLGLEAVQAAVLSVTVYELMNPAREPFDAPLPDSAVERAFDRPGFWKHLVASACGAELIAEAHPALGVKPDEAFVAGLLHDLGKIVLDLVVPRAYARVLGLAERRGVDSAAVEHSILGVDHHAAGKRIAEHWGLPAAVVDAMWLHGQEEIPDVAHARLVRVVTAASATARRLHLGWSGDYGQAPSTDEVCAPLGIEAAGVDALGARLIEAVGERCRVLGIESRSTPEMLIQSVMAANRKMARLVESLDHRGRENASRGRALEAIASFATAANPTRGVVTMLGEIVKSGASVLGPGYYAAIYQGSSGSVWQVLRFSGEGRLLRSENIDPPRALSLASIVEPGRAKVVSLGLLPWLSDALSDSRDIRELRLMGLRFRPEGPWVAIAHDREALADAVGPAAAEAMVSAWSASLTAAVQHAGAMRLGEGLADANRRLTETRAKLAEVQSMARLGELAGGIGHEMNTPLAVVSGHAQMLAERLRDESDLAAAHAIVDATEKVSRLITGLMLMSERPPVRASLYTVGEVLEAALRRTGERLGGAERVRVHVPSGVVQLLCDRELLASAIAEVMVNAIEADPAGLIEVRVNEDPGAARLMMTIEDHGRGMSQGTLEHAFDPFFSDKPAGRKTGLGLTRARRYLELHSGTIDLASEPGKGTTATVVLPIGGEEHRSAAVDRRHGAADRRAA